MRSDILLQSLKNLKLKCSMQKSRFKNWNILCIKNLRLIAKENIKEIQETARGIAQLDVILSLGEVAFTNKYVCPTIVTNGAISIKVRPPSK